MRFAQDNKSGGRKFGSLPKMMSQSDKKFCCNQSPDFYFVSLDVISPNWVDYARRCEEACCRFLGQTRQNLVH